MATVKYQVIFLILVMWATIGHSQQQGHLNIEADPRIDNLVKLHIAYNEVFPVITGYRIQIFMESGNEALKLAEEARDEFTEKYKGVPAYLAFRAPYYRVRVGDFRTRLEAEQFLQKISRDYPNSWVIEDDINFPKLINYQKTYDDE